MAPNSISRLRFHMVFAVAAMLLICTVSQAQCFDWRYSTTNEGTTRDNAISMTNDKDDNLYVFGMAYDGTSDFQGSQNLSNPNTPFCEFQCNWTYFLSKYDSTLSLQWIKHFQISTPFTYWGAEVVPYAAELALENDSTLMLAVPVGVGGISYEGSMLALNGSIGYGWHGATFMKVNTDNGSLMDTNFLSNVSLSEQEIVSNGRLIAGFVLSIVEIDTFDTVIQTGTGIVPYFIARLDSNDNYVSSHFEPARYNIFYPTTISALVETPQQGALIGMTATDTFYFNQQTLPLPYNNGVYYNGFTAFLAEFDNQLNPVGIHEFELVGNDAYTRMIDVEKSDSGYIVAVDFVDSIRFGTHNYQCSNRATLILSLNFNFDVIWSHVFCSATHFTGVYDLDVLGDRILLTGWDDANSAYNPAAINGSANYGDASFRIMKTASGGVGTIEILDDANGISRGSAGVIEEDRIAMFGTYQFTIDIGDSSHVYNSSSSNSFPVFLATWEEGIDIETSDVYLCGNRDSVHMQNVGVAYSSSAWSGNAWLSDSSINPNIQANASQWMTLTLSDTCGGSVSDSIYVEVEPGMTIQASPSGSTYTFAIADSTLCGGSEVWDYGDGNSGTSGVNTYSSSGTYEVCVECSGCKSCHTFNVVAVGLDEPLGSGIRIFPNPVESQFYISEPAQLELLDMHGKQLASWNILRSSDPVDLGFLTSGVYLIRVNGESIHRIVKL